MIFQEPKVEFVQINLNLATNYSTGGGQYCIASQPEAKYCPGWDNQVDWSQMDN